MNSYQYSSLGHRGLSFAHPLSSDKIDEALGLCHLTPSQCAVDFGAGRAEFLIRLIERFGISATAVEVESRWTDEIAKSASGRIPIAKLTIERIDANSYVKAISRPGFDLGACIGSTHAFGGFQGAIAALRKAVKPGGMIVVADLYWRQPPAAEYLQYLQMSIDDLGTLASYGQHAEASGLIPLWACSASEDDWDRYEWRCSANREAFAFENPHDPDAKAIIERSRAWRNAYLKWGRQALGFGLFVFRN